MATFQNRSRWVVTVKHRTDLTQEFPHSLLDRAEAYGVELHRSGYAPRLSHLDDDGYYRIRRRGRPKINTGGLTRRKAGDAMVEIEARMSRGLLTDDTAAQTVQFAELIQEFVATVSLHHRGGDRERVALLADFSPTAPASWRRPWRVASARSRTGRRRTRSGHAPAHLHPGAPHASKPASHHRLDRIDDAQPCSSRRRSFVRAGGWKVGRACPSITREAPLPFPLHACTRRTGPLHTCTRLDARSAPSLHSVPLLLLRAPTTRLRRRLIVELAQRRTARRPPAR
jgi:hypothetical protein